MADEAMQAELERLRAENEALKKPRSRGALSLKVSEKGGVSVYGLGRFPVTLYKEQWESCWRWPTTSGRSSRTNDALPQDQGQARSLSGSQDGGQQS